MQNFTKSYDQFQTLATESQLAVTVLANPSVTDVELVPLKPRAASDKALDELAASGRGLEFLGVLGIVNGQPRSALAAPLDDVRVKALADAFRRYCEVEVMLGDRIAEMQMGDSLEFLEALYRLEDPRPN